MSFLKQLLKPFVEFDAEAPATQQAKPPAAPAAPVPAAPAPIPTPAPPVIQKAPENVTHPLINKTETVTATSADDVPAYSPSGTLIEPLKEHVQYFEKLIDEANISNPMFQGTDFKEFVDSKVDIDDIADESLKYRTAFNVLKSTGLTRDKLLSTGQEYINLIGRDLNAFQTAHAQKYGKEVGQKEAVLQKKAEELQQLVQRMNALKAEINQVTQDITVSKEKLNTIRSSFLLAGENKQQEIDTELQKIAQYF